MTRVAVEAGPDAGAAWHYGNPVAEQRALLAGGAVDLSHREILTVDGPERLTWLHAITSQAFTGLAPGVVVDACILDAQGRLAHVFTAHDDGERVLLHTEPGRGDALRAHLERMVFATRVTLGGGDGLTVVGTVDGERPMARVVASGAAAEPTAGLWAWEALRIAAGVPRFGVDTDDRTIPNELGLFGTALDKGCYPGQETVGRVHTLGRPPRRLVRLHLDGSADALPAAGAPLVLAGRDVGFVGSSARHYELGPIALGLVKRATPVEAGFVVDGIAAAQEALVDPDVGLHVRPRLG